MRANKSRARLTSGLCKLSNAGLGADGVTGCLTGEGTAALAIGAVTDPGTSGMAIDGGICTGVGVTAFGCDGIAEGVWAGVGVAALGGGAAGINTGVGVAAFCGAMDAAANRGFAAGITADGVTAAGAGATRGAAISGFSSGSRPLANGESFSTLGVDSRL